MMMTICSKFGTRGGSVAIGVTGGFDVAVEAAGVGIDVDEGTDEGVMAGVEGAHATSTIKNRAQKPKRVIRASLTACLIIY